VISEIGNNERSDPYHFGLSLIRRIMSCPGQEIGTHTFSHYYCLEPGQDERAFRADLEAAERAALRLGISLRSITFPRHQINYLRTCREAGLIAFRGQPRAWMHDPNQRRMPARRALRLADAYLNLSGHNARRAAREASGMIDVPASRFLRPFASRLSSLEGRKFRRIAGGMRTAAAEGAIYHLWWHPHNFGAHLEDNLAMLRRILNTFRELALEYGMQANTMAEIADLAGSEPRPEAREDADARRAKLARAPI
jgi:peptidoglycan/xylan/chitin deacetylase (PgdA/CDA1 family)